MAIGFDEVLATQRMIRELREAGREDGARALEAVLAAATDPTPDLPTPAFLTPHEAARSLGLNVRTVEEWAARGLLTVEQLGDRRVVRRDDVLDLIERWPATVPVPAPLQRPGRANRQRALRADLPADLVRRVEAYHARIEDGEPLSRRERADLAALERRVADLAAARLARSAPRAGT